MISEEFVILGDFIHKQTPFICVTLFPFPEFSYGLYTFVFHFMVYYFITIDNCTGFNLI
jgi:hypothetical protein